MQPIHTNVDTLILVKKHHTEQQQTQAQGASCFSTNEDLHVFRVFSRNFLLSMNKDFQLMPIILYIVRMITKFHIIAVCRAISLVTHTCLYMYTCMHLVEQQSIMVYSDCI